MEDEEAEEFGTKWMRWQHKFAWGQPKGWEWREVVDHPGAIREVLDNLAEYSFSDKYRGIDYELFDTPDPEWLAKQLEEKRQQAVSLAARIDELEKLLKRLQG